MDSYELTEGSIDEMKLYHHHIIIFLCGLFALINSSFAASVDRVLDVSQISTDPVSLTQYFDVLEDPSTTLTLADIKRTDIAANFTESGSSSDSLNFSFTKSAIWLRFKVRNFSDQPQDQILEIANARLADVKLYGALPQNAGQVMASGFKVTFDERPYSHRFIVFPLTLEPNTTKTLYLRVMSTTIEVSAKVWQRSAYLPYERHDYMIQASYFGMVLAMVVFNLLLFISLRDVSYLLYVSWISLVAMVMLSTTGIGMEFLWDDMPVWTTVTYSFFSLLGTSVLIFFMRKMTYIQTAAPKTDKLLINLAGFNLFLILGLFVNYPVFAKLTMVVVTFESLLILTAASYCAIKGHHSARFFVAAFFIYIVAIIITTLRLAGVVPINVITVNGLQIGSVIEMILLAFALADRYNQLRQEKSIAQQHLVETLQNSERILDEKVEQRTLELKAVFKANQTILMHSPLPMIVIASKGQCIEVNDAFSQLIGRTRTQLLASNPATNSSWLDSAIYNECQNTLSSNEPRQREIQVDTTYGKVLWLDLRFIPLELKGEQHVLVQAVDLTERKRHEEELKEMAFYDALTQLPNRRLLLDRLRHALDSSKRLNSYGALLFLDLNKFKQLNDTHGHEAGDQMLVEVAKRLKQITRDTDTVARLGGDEFVVLLEGLGPDVSKANESATQMVDKIRHSLTEEYILGEIHLRGSASIGISVFLGDENDSDQIIKNADEAMYEVKQSRPR